MCKYQVVSKGEKEGVTEETLPYYITTGDFTIQNVSLKIGIPILSIDGIEIKNIKNYIFKCFSCSK